MATLKVGSTESKYTIEHMPSANIDLLSVLCMHRGQREGRICDVTGLELSLLADEELLLSSSDV